MIDDGPASPFLATAIEAVRRAGAIQQAAFGGDIDIRKKGTIDLVTEVDMAVERMIRALIAERHPDHDILAEELGGPAGGARSRYCWIVDPLDGTTNFAHGLPLFCCTVALEVDGRLEVGAVYDPTRDELFTAERGRGAFLNGRRLRVSSADRLIDALLVTGFPYTLQERMPELLGLFGAFLAEARAVRRLGSAALDICYVAAGRMDGFWEQGLNPWDIAAGVLLVEEAGGRVTSLDGGPFDLRAGRIVASNGLVHDDMLRVIREFYASRS
ncbi:MAG TPA: inositol monophosphatase family protein [Vicinamibacterales bacterium]